MSKNSSNYLDKAPKIEAQAMRDSDKMKDDSIAHLSDLK